MYILTYKVLHEDMYMVRMTFSIPDDLKKKLDQKPDINWTEIFKQGLKNKLETLEKLRAKGAL